jgi:hypothetical protein
LNFDISIVVYFAFYFVSIVMIITAQRWNGWAKRGTGWAAISLWICDLPWQDDGMAV